MGAVYTLGTSFQHSGQDQAEQKPLEKKTVAGASQAMLEAARKAHVKDDEPMGVFVASQADLALAQNEDRQELRAMIGELRAIAGTTINRVDVKIALLSVMTEAKSEFLRIVAKECTGMILAGGAVVAAASFILGYLVASH
jgi:hypothetical protein